MKVTTTGRLFDDGFSLVELLAAMVLALIVIGGMFALVNPAGYVATAQPDAIDVQQRVRVGAGALYRDLYVAGAGLDAGLHAGSLIRRFPAVVPRRLGAIAADPPDVARFDVVSLIWVPEDAVQSELVSLMSGATVTVREGGSCRPLPACGFGIGMGALIFDTSGHFDLFTVTDLSGPRVTLRSRGPSSGHAYSVGVVAAEVQARTYYLDKATKQLRQYDTDLTDVPLLDDVTDLRVEYFGTPGSPTLPKPPIGEGNCLYDEAGQALPSSSTLSAGPGGLAELPLPLFTDGPWCGTGTTQFDADLLRIRLVRVTIGAQVSSAASRSAGPGFSSPGTSRSAWRRVPDVVVSLDVAPRNLNLE